MLLKKFTEEYERKVFDRRVAESQASLPGPVDRDDNNLFSLQEVLGIPEVDVVSFDFFDTLFFRQHLCLAQVMEKTAQLGSTLVPADRADVLSAIYAARGYTSAQLKRTMIQRGEGDEPSLHSVLTRALRRFVPDEARLSEIAHQIVEIEAAVELRNLVPNSQILSVFRNLKLLGRKVIITSDMYLPASAIEAILESHGIMEFVDELIVSSEYGITKNSGDLFRIVIEKAGVPAHRILHVGDNWTNDVVRARENGLIAYHYYNHRRESDVQRLETRFNVPCPTSVRRSTLSDNFELASDQALTSLEEVITQVIGPACAIFAHEFMHRAARNQSSHLFFLTRDGTIFKEIADAMREAVPELYPAKSEHKILASSRSTGVILGVQRTDSDYLYINTEYLTEKTFSFKGFLALFGIPQSGIDSLPQVTLDRIADLGDAMSLVEFRDLYWAYPGFQDLVMDILEDQKSLIMSYLEQTGVFEAHAPLLVDIGYSGTWGKQIAPVLEAREFNGQTVPEMSFEFFASNRFFTNNVRSLHPSITMQPGRILDHRNIDCLTAALNYCWLEPFFLDPNLGKLEGFTNGNNIQPQFRPSRYNIAEKARIEGMRHAIVGRCQQFAEDILRHEGDIEELKRQVVGRLVKLIGYPRRSEVAAFNQLSHERGMKTVDKQEIAVTLKPNNLRAKLAYLMENDHWVQGSLARSHLGVLNHYVAWRYGRDRSDLVDWRP